MTQLNKARILTGGLACLLPMTALAQGRGPELSRLTLQLSTDKATYLPGELVRLRVRLTNATDTAQAAPERISVGDGSLQVYAASEPDQYLRYDGPGWGTSDSPGWRQIDLPPGQSIQTDTTLLYHRKPATQHLNRTAAEAVERGQLRDEYALSRPGVYQLKAVLFSEDYATRIESDPVAVTILTPVGPEAEAWNVLRGNPKLGYLVQTGVLPGASSPTEEEAAVAALSEIVARQPDGVYAAHIRPRLDRFRSRIQRERGRLPE